jgi:tetratricopeptide (TPR) repeat protein
MPEASKKQTVVTVSSTERDLPEHRKEVLDACLRMGMLPVMMEHLTAGDADAAAKSLAMVDGADIYMGVFAYRYGYVPEANNPERISITEMEYNRAVERGIPRLIFFMDKSHTLTAADMEEDTSDPVEVARRKVKLAELKGRAGKERVVASFKSPVDLRALVIQALVEFREPDLTTFHYVSDIPAPPEAFIAHPYTLLQTHRLVGRQPELNLLTDWVAKPDSEVYKAHILNIVAVGGMGKSALTWNWFNDIAPQEMKPLAGRMWWSFYESDATFENFVTRAFAYVTRRPLDEVQQMPAPDRETQLLASLDRQPFLLVLDGLERILIAYSRMDAARLEDSQVGNQRNLRKTADPRAGRFLKRLTQVRNSRILVSTRLYPAELETEGGDSTPRSFRLNITGLTDEDAVELWRALNTSGSRDLLLPVFATFNKHPLLIQALAGEVKRYRRAPDNFEEWRKANPRFDPAKFPHLQDAMSHVLEFALRGLDSKAHKTLQIIAAFRMPTTYDTLTALLVGRRKTHFDLRTGKVTLEEGKLFDEEKGLDAILTELEDRGLVGWDKRANRYDLHPIVRGVVWSGLTDVAQRSIYRSLHKHFEALPMFDDYFKVNSLEDLTPVIELYNSLIGLRRYNDAIELFLKRLYKATLWRLSAIRQQAELIEMLFPNGLEQLPRLSNQNHQGLALTLLALAYQYSGQPGQAALLLHRSKAINSERNDENAFSVSLGNLSEALLLSGILYQSEAAARQALLISRRQKHHFNEMAILNFLGWSLAVRNIKEESEAAFQRSLRISISESYESVESYINAHLAQRALWFSELDIALLLANNAWGLAHVSHAESHFIRAARLQGVAGLGLNDFITADERLHHALTRARMVNRVEEELPALVALAELRRRQGDLGAARELLDDVWEAAKRGPYPLFHADACNVLAEVERDEGNWEKAVEAAEKAYRLAWCDGPPFAYHWGLERARGLLRELGAGEPELPPFDESKFEPMPEVEIDPADEFGAGSVEGAEAEE